MLRQLSILWIAWRFYYTPPGSRCGPPANGEVRGRTKFVSGPDCDTSLRNGLSDIFNGESYSTNENEIP